MTDVQDHRRLSELFRHLVELPPERRAAELERCCGDDHALRERLSAMLAQDDDATFLDGSALDRFQTRTAGNPAGTAHAAPLPERIGPYAVRRLLGEGGMGTVYVATQENPRREVALKVLRHGLASPDAQRRFATEAQVLGRLRHPGVAQIFESGSADVGGLRVPYLVMEYVEGATTLLEATERLGLDRDARLALFADVCEAVHHGHQKGVVHRDLKPTNILVDGEGRPKVIDFGVARCVDDDGSAPRDTRTGQLLGTPQYMSPEQCGADPGAVDTRSDVYSLGVILHELLTGVLPYELEHLSIPEAVAVIRQAPPRRDTLRLPADLVTIVHTALEKDPDRRYASANALALDVRRFLDHEPIAARPPSLAYRWRSFVRRHRIAVAATASVILVSLGAAAVSLLLWRESERKNAVLEQAGYAGQVRQAHGALRRGNARLAAERLAQTDPALRGWEWHHLDRLAHPELLRFRLPAGSLHEVRITADGTTLVTTSIDPDTRAARVGWWDARSGEPLRPELVIDGPVHALGPLDAALDRLLVLPDPAHVALLSLPDGERRWTSAPQPFPVRSVAWNEARDELLLLHKESAQVQRLATSTGRRRSTLDGFSGHVSGIAASPSGRWLALSHDGVLSLWDAEHPDAVRTLELAAFDPTAFAFRPDESAIAVASGGAVGLYDLATGRLDTGGFIAVDDGADRLAWTPDGRGLLTSSRSHRLDLRFLPHPVPRDTWLGLPAEPISLGVSADGGLVTAGTSDGWVHVWRSTYSRDSSFADDKALGQAIDAAGGRLYLTGWGMVRAVDVRTGAPLWTRWVANAEFNRAAVVTERGLLYVGGQRHDLHALRLDDGVREATVPHAIQHRLPEVAPAALRFAPGPDGEPIERYHRLGGGRLHQIESGPDGEVLVVATDAGLLRALRADDGHEFWSHPPLDALLWQAVHVRPPPDRLREFTDGASSWFAGERPADDQWLTREPVALDLAPITGRVAATRRHGAPELSERSWLVEVRALRTGEPLWHRPLPDHATAVAWSPDEAWLVAAVPGAGVLRFSGHDGTPHGVLFSELDPVSSLAFSAAGDRLVMGGLGVDVWDTRTWDQILLLERAGRTQQLAFLPDDDGLLLVSGSRFSLLESRAPDAALRAEREHQRRARAVVEPLFDELHAAERVRARLLADDALDPAVRTDALQLAMALADNPNELNSRAWGIVWTLHGDRERYETALAYAETAVAIRPESASFRNTLALAQLHVGQYDRALESFALCNAVNRGEVDGMRPYWDGPHPLDLAGMALAEHARGRLEVARERLAQAEAAVQRADSSMDQVTDRFLRRAQELLAVDP